VRVGKEEFVEAITSGWSKITSDNVITNDYVQDDLEKLYEFIDRKGWIIVKRAELEKIRKSCKELLKIYPDDRASRLIVKLINKIIGN